MGTMWLDTKQGVLSPRYQTQKEIKKGKEKNVQETGTGPLGDYKETAKKRRREREETETKDIALAGENKGREPREEEKGFCAAEVFSPSLLLSHSSLDFWEATKAICSLLHLMNQGRVVEGGRRTKKEQEA